jgi:hypothetical protein
MPKLEELVTPTELLAAVKEGALKQELVKKYKASEQELAMMLLPMYRRGELTKDEFNDFFKGVSRKGTGAEDESAFTPTQVETEPPSEILQSLSRIFGKKPKEPKVEAGEEALALKAEPEHKAVETAVLEAPVPEPVSAPSAEAVSGPAAAIGPELEPEAPEEIGEDIPEEGVGAIDSVGLASLLNSIFDRLNSIDQRLAEIEKRIARS